MIDIAAMASKSATAAKKVQDAIVLEKRDISSKHKVLKGIITASRGAFGSLTWVRYYLLYALILLI